MSFDADLEQRLAPSVALVARLAAGEEPVYGVNTGFGSLANTRIAPEEAEELQLALIRSHAAAVGAPLPREIVRGMMAIRCSMLARGRSAVRPQVVRAIAEMLNRDLVPEVPETGSLGASGDLAQLAHTFLPLIGEGRFLDGRSPAEAGLSPLRLAPKEGLALLNGTDAMLSAGLLVSRRVANLLKTADVVAAMTVEGALGSSRPFQARLHEVRGQAGQLLSAANLAQLLDGSQIVASHRASNHAVQDAYSLRCTPQVHGAARDGAGFAAQQFGRELGAIIDNPLVFVDTEEVISGGNFHGEPLAFAHDMLAIVLAELASISERRLNRLLDPKLSQGLPPFLSRHSGLNSGLMLSQYTAAALVTELRLLAAPASVHSISTSAEQEDHVSMGWTAARQALRGAELCAQVLAIEAIAAAQALELRAPIAPAVGTAAALAAIRVRVPALEGDRVLAGDLAAALELVRDGTIAGAAEAAAGALR